MSIIKDMNKVKEVQDSLQSIFDDLESTSTKDIILALESLRDIVEEYNNKVELKEKLESLLLDAMEYPVEVLGEVVEVLEGYELPDAEFSVNALESTTESSVVYVCGKKYKKVPEVYGCRGCVFDGDSLGCSKALYEKEDKCSSEEIIYKEVFTDD